MPKKSAKAAPKKRTKKSSTKQTKVTLTYDTFYQVMADLRTYQQVETFCKDFFTDSEKDAFAKRLAITQSLKEGLSYEQIRKKYGVSSATISSVAEQMTTPGFQIAQKKMDIEAWAEKMADRIGSWFGVKEV